MAYATIDDLTIRWQPITDPTQIEQATVLLDDASVQLRSEIPDLAARIEAGDTDLAAAAVRVECAMVKRAMTAGDGGFGVTSAQETQGPFSRTFQYSNPMGDLYVTKAERRLLQSGVTQSAYTVSMFPTDASPFNVLDWLGDVRAADPTPRLTGFE